MNTKPLSILIVSQYFWPENFRITDFAAGLVEKGHKVTVLTGKPNYPQGQIFSGYRFWGIQTEEYSGVKVIRVPLIPRGGGGGLRLALNYLSFVFFACLLGPCKIMFSKFDFIFSYQPSPITVFLPAILIKWIKRIPLYVWVQDLWPESLVATGAIRSKFILGGVGHLVNFIYSQCDKIFVQSMGFVAAISNRGVDPNKIIYMPNWAENIFSNSASRDAASTETNVESNVESSAESSVEPSADATREQALLAMAGEFKILFAGNIGEAQDFPTLLAAAAALKDDKRVHWYIVGDGRKKDWVIDKISQLGLGHCVHLLGQFPLSAMPSFFKCADVLLVSLKKEPIFALTIPGKLQSYLASGKPILASLDGEGGRVVREASAGFVCPSESPAELAQLVVSFLNTQPAELAKMGVSGKNYFAKNFDRDLIISGFEKKVYGLLGLGGAQ